MLKYSVKSGKKLFMIEFAAKLLAVSVFVLIGMFMNTGYVVRIVFILFGAGVIYFAIKSFKRTEEPMEIIYAGSRGISLALDKKGGKLNIPWANIKEVAPVGTSEDGEGIYKGLNVVLNEPLKEKPESSFCKFAEDGLSVDVNAGYSDVPLKEIISNIKEVRKTFLSGEAIETDEEARGPVSEMVNILREILRKKE